MLPALVLCIEIRAEFWRPLEKQGKTEWIKYISVCCPPQNEHIDIKTVANSHVGVTLKIRQKRPNIHVLLLLCRTFFVQAVSRELP